nr:hypothetical protein [Anaerolineae bacterium]NIO00370.1 hypothetical protein [Anaerolineae bacterium]NIQ83141.1 hypothetical protein [Anaerolineae bacterium]
MSRDYTAWFSVLIAALILSLVRCAGPGPVEEPAAPEASPQIVEARDAALAYVREHFEGAPAESLPWVEERLTPEDVPGGATWGYTADGWMVTVSYAVLPPEWTVYRVAVSQEATGFRWEGRVDASGRVPEGPERMLVARDAALGFVTEQYAQQGLGSGLAWQEERLVSKGIVGVESYQYSTGDWVVTVSYPVLALDQTVYEVSVVNQNAGFHWEAEVDAQGRVAELGGEGPEVLFDKVAARDAAM